MLAASSPCSRTNQAAGPVTEEPPVVPVSGEAFPALEVASVFLGPDGSKLCLYEQIRKRNIAEREHAWNEHVKNGNY